MITNAMPIDTVGRTLSSVQPRNTQPVASSAQANPAPAVVQPADAVAFPATDVVQVSSQARGAQQSADTANTPSRQNASAQASGGEDQDLARVRELIAELQKQTTAVTFSYSKDDGDRLVIQVVNKATGEVVRQVPPEEMLKLSERMKALKGFLFEKTS